MALVAGAAARHAVRTAERLSASRAAEAAARSVAATAARSSAFGAAVDRANELLGARSSTVWAVDGDGVSLHTHAGSGDAGSADTAVAQAHRRGVAAWEPGGRLLVPLIAHGETVGVLDVHAPRVDGAAGRAAVVAELLGPALASDRYRQELEARNRERGELLDSVLEIADRERELVAHRLHDGPLQTMTALRLIADVARGAVESGDVERARGLLDQLEGYAAEAADELRRMTGRLHPVVMEQRGLPQALSALAETVEEEYGIAASYSGPGRGWVTRPERDTGIYQIAREAALLAVHGRAAPIAIALDGDGGPIRLLITGGTLAADGDTTRDLSLRLMRERAARLGADLAVRCDPGEPLEAALLVPAGPEHGTA